MNDTLSPNPDRHPDEPATYVAPAIALLGTVADLTAGESAGSSDLDAGFSGDFS